MRFSPQETNSVASFRGTVTPAASSRPYQVLRCILGAGQVHCAQVKNGIFPRFPHSPVRVASMQTLVMAVCGFLASLPVALALRAMAHDGSAAPGGEQESQRWTLSRLDDAEKLEQPWGWIRWTINAQIDPSATMTVGVVYLKPNQTNPLHIHPNSDEILIVVEGTLEHRMGNGWVKMGPGDTIRIPKGAKHNARTGNEPCKVVVVYDTAHRQFVPAEENSQ